MEVSRAQERIRRELGEERERGWFARVGGLLLGKSLLELIDVRVESVAEEPATRTPLLQALERVRVGKTDGLSVTNI